MCAKFSGSWRKLHCLTCVCTVLLYYRVKILNWAGCLQHLLSRPLFFWAVSSLLYQAKNMVILHTPNICKGSILLCLDGKFVWIYYSARPFSLSGYVHTCNKDKTFCPCWFVNAPLSNSSCLHRLIIGISPVEDEKRNWGQKKWYRVHANTAVLVLLFKLFSPGLLKIFY